MANNQDFVDYSKTVNRDSNYLCLHGNGIAGYVKFKTKGYLQARSYDDIYGDVYCGWSPHKIQLNPTELPVYVSLSRCAVGDGGIDQVTELCWFPEGKKEGVVVFSTKHPSATEPVEPEALYRKDLLGNSMYFNEFMATSVIDSYLRKGEINEAKKVISDSLALLSSMKGAIEGSTGRHIPSQEMNAESWAKLLSYKLGLELEEKSFEETESLFSAIVNNSSKYGYYRCRTAREMLPIYNWLNNQICKKECEALHSEQLASGSMDHQPSLIAKYLVSEINTEAFKKKTFSNNYFWIGIKDFLAGNHDAAKEQFRAFLKEKNYGFNGFELAAAAKLNKTLNTAQNSGISK
ncbi:MAG: hypothetical protein K2X27_11020 [Candidatus Obscuribacterales bacterium]|nr:hypothetical protein [Candidatus Obscuribacterales bacterium]